MRESFADSLILFRPYFSHSLFMNTFFKLHSPADVLSFLRSSTHIQFLVENVLSVAHYRVNLVCVGLPVRLALALAHTHHIGTLEINMHEGFEDAVCISWWVRKRTINECEHQKMMIVFSWHSIVIEGMKQLAGNHTSITKFNSLPFCLVASKKFKFSLVELT